MAFDLAAARQAGYSDDEIADGLGAPAGVDVAAARKAGYASQEIIDGIMAGWQPTEGDIDRAGQSVGAPPPPPTTGPTNQLQPLPDPLTGELTRALSETDPTTETHQQLKQALDIHQAPAGWGPDEIAASNAAHEKSVTDFVARLRSESPRIAAGRYSETELRKIAESHLPLPEHQRVSWQQVGKAIPETIEGGALQTMGGALQREGEIFIEDVNDPRTLMGNVTAIMRLLGGGKLVEDALKGAKVQADEGARIARKGITQSTEAIPAGKKLGTLQEGVVTAANSLAQMAPGAVAAAATRSPVPLLGMMGAQTRAQTYAAARNPVEGATVEVDPRTADLVATLDGLVEAGTEIMPALQLFKRQPGLAKRVTAVLAAEVPSELVATTLQDLDAKLSYNPDMTFGEYIDDLKNTLISTSISAPVQAGIAQSLHAAGRKIAGKPGGTPPTAEAPPTPPETPVAPPVAPAPEATATPEAAPSTAVQGAPRRIWTAKGDAIDTNLEVVEAADLVASHDASGKVNVAFPAEMQPRDRSRQASRAQISTMAQNLKPELLGDTGTASDGAPVVGPDSVVESGNARTLAIRQAYQTGKGAGYKAWLEQNAEAFGIDPGQLSGITEPVLIRRRTAEMTNEERAGFARDANQANIAAMAPAEVAKTDAVRITNQDMAHFAPDESGNVLAASNDVFLRQFAKRLGANEIAGMMTSDGRPTKQMADRIQQAVFAKAYGDERLIALQAEEANPDIRNILSGLTQAAPVFARAKAIDPELGNLNVIPNLIEASDIIRKARGEGRSVADLLAQQGLFSDVSPETSALAQFMDGNKRSAKRMGEAFKTLGQTIEDTLRGRQNEQLFGDDNITLRDVIESAGARVSKDYSGEQDQGDLLQTAPPGETKMKFNETGWESLGTVEYNRRLNAYLNRMNSGIDRDDEHAAVEYVRKLFDELDAQPLDRAAIAHDEAAARKLEDGDLSKEVFQSREKRVLSATKGLQVSAIRQTIDPIIAKWTNAPQVNVVQSVTQLPDYLLRALKAVGGENDTRGFFDPQTNHVWLIADHIKSAQVAQSVLFHESLGHYGLREMFGPELNPILRKVYAVYGKNGLYDIARRYGLDLSKEKHQLIAAEEMLAHIAETGERPGLIARLAHFIREWLRRHGFKITMTDADVRILVALSGRAVERGVAKQGVAFKSEQIKSAVDNRGTFDANDPNILHANPFNIPLNIILSGYRKTAQKLVDRFHDKIGYRYDALRDLPQKEKFTTRYHALLGKISEIGEVQSRLYAAFRDTTEASKIQVYEYLTTRGASEALVLDPAVRRNAVAAKRLIDRIGERLVHEGLLSGVVRDAHRGEYLPRIYLKHLLGESSFKALGRGMVPSDFGYLKARKDIPDDVRRLILGEIKDPGYLASRGYGIPARDVAILDFFQDIAANKQWIFPNAIAQWGGKPVSVFWLKAEAERLMHQLPYMPAADKPQVEQIILNMRSIYEPMVQRLGKNPDKFKQIPDTAKYGGMRGLYVREEIFNLILGERNITVDSDTFQKIINAATWWNQIWKTSKVVWNPPSQVRNFVSNGMLLHLSGVPFELVPVRLAQAIKSVRTNDVYWRTAKKYGVKAASFSNQEMARVERDLLDLLAREQGKFSLATVKNMAGIVNNAFGDAYQFSETLWKTAKIIDVMKREGKSAATAANAAHEALFDYSMVPPFVKKARTSPIGIPFITFYYKALPMLLRTAIVHPERYIPYLAIPYILAAMIKDDYDVTDEDLKHLQKALPTWMEEKGTAYILPWKDSNGRWQAVDVGYFMPWGNYQTLTNVFTGAATEGAMGRTGDVLSAVGAFGGPLPNLITAIQANTDPFTKREIANKSDPPARQLSDMMLYLYRMNAPTWVTDIGVAGHMYRTLTGKVNARLGPQYGEQLSTLPQAALRGVGVNIYPIDPEATRIENLRGMGYDIKAVVRRLKTQLRNPNLTEEQRTTLINEYQGLAQERVQRMETYAQESEVAPALRRDIQ